MPGQDGPLPVGPLRNTSPTTGWSTMMPYRSGIQRTGLRGDRGDREHLQSAAPRQQEPRRVWPEGLNAAEWGWRRPASCHETASCRELQAPQSFGTAAVGRRCQCRAVAPQPESSLAARARAHVGIAVLGEGVQKPSALHLPRRAVQQGSVGGCSLVSDYVSWSWDAVSDVDRDTRRLCSA